MASPHAPKQQRKINISDDGRARISLAVKRGWANTVDRTARQANAIAKGPQSVQWHLDRLPAKFDDATEEQRLVAAEAAKKVYFAELRLKGLEVRRRNKQARLNPTVTPEIQAYLDRLPAQFDDATHQQRVQAAITAMEIDEQACRLDEKAAGNIDGDVR